MKPACYLPAPTPVWTADLIGTAALKAIIGAAVLYCGSWLIGFASCIGALS